MLKHYILRYYLVWHLCWRFPYFSIVSIRDNMLNHGKLFGCLVERGQKFYG
jgi:hypothetical protein